jgi:hypothetical protein
VSGASNIVERAAAHIALATVLKDDPDRSVWHRAAATVGPDERVAQDLESAGTRALQRGDVRVAIQALERAAELSADTTRRARCLLKASELAFEIGWNDLVVRLLQKAETLELSRRDRVWLTWFREAAQRSISGAEALKEIADSIKTDDDVDLALDLLSGPATKGWWAEPDEEVCKHVIGAVERVRASSGDDPRFVLIVAMTDPIDRGVFVIERLRRFAANLNDDPRTAHLLGLADPSLPATRKVHILPGSRRRTRGSSPSSRTRCSTRVGTHRRKQRGQQQDSCLTCCLISQGAKHRTRPTAGR